MSQPIIRIQDLSFTYPGADSPVLRNVNLTVEKGAFAAVIGNNGSGKTTLCKALNGVIPHFINGEYEGRVEVNGKNALESSVAALARDVAYVYQDFENQLVRSTVYEDAIFAPLNFGFDDYAARGMRALELLGLEGIRDKFIWQLSGGQKHLVALAGALALDPDILIIDEPAAQLDPMNAALLYEKLSMLNRELGKTILVIEHHTEFIADCCDTVILMRDGGVCWRKPVGEALNRYEELTACNIYPPQVTQAALLACRQAGVSIGARLPVTLSEAREFFRGFPVPAHKPISAVRPPAGRKPVVEIRGVTCDSVADAGSGRPILSDIDLTVYEGDRLAIVGNNGAGKTTLLKLVCGIAKPTRGTVAVCGNDTRKTSPGDLSDVVAYVFQNPEEMFIDDCIRRDIEYSLRSRRHPQTDAIVDEVVDVLHLGPLQQRDGRLLSGGQQRRASLAIGVATRPSAILLDEPTCSLDISSRREMIALLDSMKDWIQTAVIATHDMQLAAEWANRVIVMKDGRIISDSGAHQVFENPELLRSANLRPPQIVELSQMTGLQPMACSPAEYADRLTQQGEGIAHGEHCQAV